MFLTSDSNPNSSIEKANIKNITDEKSTKTNMKDEEYEEFISYFRQSNIPPPEQWPRKSSVFVSSSIRAPYIQYSGISDQDKCISKTLYKGESNLDDIEMEEHQSNLSKSSLNSLNTHAATPFPVNGEIIPFDGPLFSGIIASRVKDIPVSRNDINMNRISNKNYFKGRSRQFQWTVQGKFKHRTRFDQVVTGQDFGRPFRNAPTASLVKRGMNLLKSRLPDSFVCDLFSESPKFEHPLLAGCQYFRIDDDDADDRRSSSKENDSILQLRGENDKGEIIEDTALLNDSTVPKDSEGRRKYFAKQENLEKYYFETDYVYSFDFFANFFSPARHCLELTPFFCIDLIPYFNGYPLFMAMAKEKSSGTYFWGTEIWHERLMNFNEKPGLIARLLSSKSKNEK